VERYSGAVIEAGGSLVSELETFNVLRSAFFTVWVRAKPEDHMSRVVQQGDLRPMEGNQEAMEDLRRILIEREPYYGVANYMISTSGRSVDDCLVELDRVCRPYLRHSS
jgi:XRE family aerobic/anaerobic benzoate catabolism transcriptional regulator